MTRVAVRSRARQSGAVGRRLIVALAVLVLIVAALLAAVTWGPHWARERIAAAAGEALGRRVTIGAIDVSPFAGRVTVSGFAIAGRDGAPPSVELESLRLELDVPASLRGIIAVRSVRLVEPVVRAARLEAERFDFSDIVERIAARPPSEGKTTWRVERVGIERGSIDFDDRLVGKRTRVAALEAAADWLTNDERGAARPTAVTAAFTLDERPVRIEASATPFAAAKDADVTARIDALPLAAVLPYVALPRDVRVVAGHVDVDARATYRPTASSPPDRLKVAGRIALVGTRIDDAEGRERVSAKSLAVTLAESTPLGGTLHVAELALQAPRASLGRRADGGLDWPAPAGSAPPAPAPAPAPAPPAPGAAAPSAPTPSAHAAPRGPALRIDKLALTDGSVAWRDPTLPAPLALSIAPLAVQAESLAVSDFERPAITGRLRAEAGIDASARLVSDVELQGRAGSARVELAGVSLPRYARLAGPALRASLAGGSLSARAALGWNLDDGSWSLRDGSLELADLLLEHRGQRPAAIRRLALAGVSIDAPTRRVTASSLRIEDARLAARRDRQGRIDLLDWYDDTGTAPRADPRAPAPAPAPATAPATRTAARAATPAAPAWTVALAQAEITRLDLDYSDQQVAPDRKLPSARIALKASNLTTDLARPVPFDARIQLSEGSSLDARGQVRPAPLDLDAQLRLRRFVVTHFDPYVAPYLNLTIASGQLWGRGQLRVATGADGSLARIGYDGEFSANDFRAIDKVNRDDFVRWSALALPSVKVDWRPDAPGKSLVEIGDVAFIGFFARIILDANGRLNLSGIFADPEAAGGQRSITRAADASATPAPSGSASGSSPRAASGTATSAEAPARQDDANPFVQPSEPPEGRRSAVIAAPATPPGERPTVRVGTVRIAGGNVDFTDLFIRPNYNANLTRLVGSVDAVASDRTEPSDVLVTGMLDDDAPLEITGKVNPLAPSAFVDLRAVARGFDLPRLSPYSGRWAGYAIEKGKLTADVRYRIEGDRLDAQNKLVINQLTFGDKVDSPDATKLPVRFAISLLKDRNGNIDLDLPISGTLSDPQFSVGGLIARAIFNLIVRVVTSPFTFLASLAGGGGSPEMSHVEFAPGVTTLTDDGRKRLDGLAKALADRPGLSLEIAGFADPDADRAGLSQARFDRLLKTTKLAALRSRNPTAELPPIDEVVVDAAERASLIEQAYREARFEKPRTAAGQPRPVPPEEMERLLRAHAADVAANEIPELATRRAQAARDYLRETGGVSNERLFLLAPRVGGGDDKKLPPRRVDFSLRQ